MKFKNFIFLGLIALSGCKFSSLDIRGIRPQKEAFSILWIRNTDPPYKTGNLPIALNSPLMHKGVLYSGDGSGVMKAYRARDGRVLWSKEDGGDYHSGILYSEGNIIYGNSNGRIFARKANSGELVYSIDVGAGVEGIPGQGMGRIFFHLRDHRIVCLDPKSGKMLWSYRRRVPYTTTLQGVSTPTVSRGKLYVGLADGTVVALSIEEGVLLWEQKIVLGNKFVDVDTTPVFFAGKMIFAEGSEFVNVMDAKSGRTIRKLSYSLSHTPLIYQGHLILGTWDGEIVVLNKKFRQIGKFKVSSHAINSIVLWKGRLAVATVGGEVHLVESIIDGKSIKGNILKTVHLGHSSSAVFGQMTTDEGKLGLLSSRNRIYVFQ